MRELTAAAEDYLKTIWSAHEWHTDTLTTSALATRMGHAASTTSESVRKLTEQGLVAHRKHGPIELTEAGRAAALSVVRRHRLLETFLVTTLGYGWDEVHEEAEVLEHAVSDKMIDRIDAALGHPERDPHGDPIPRADGGLDRPDAVPLSEASTDAPLVVVRVADDSADLLRYLESLAVGLDTRVVLRARNDAAGVVTVELDGVTRDLGLPAAGAIYVLPG